jgi:putative ABC transport system permease protein
VRVGALFYFYARRLRTHPVQELFAGAGIAIGVALVFAVVVANESIGASASQMTQAIAGSASLQLAARDAQGFDAALLGRVRAISGVLHAAPLLEQRATVTGPRGASSVELVGVDPSLPSLGGSLTRGFHAAAALVLESGILLPSATAHAIGVSADTRSPARIGLRLHGLARVVPVGAVLGPGLIGPLSEAFVAVAPLHSVQALADLPRRVTRILVVPGPGRTAAVRRALVRLAGGRITVASVASEERLLAQASAPNDQATGLFAAIAAFVGLLLAFNAMLLTVPERRRSIAGLRLQGFSPRQVVLVLGFQALTLGVVASLVGLVAGDVLSRTVFDTTPTYLTFAFALGTQHVVAPQTAVVAFLGGVAVTCLAAAQPLLDLRPRRAVDAVYREGGEPGQELTASLRHQLSFAALALLAITTVLVALAPSTTVVGVGALALATLLAMPAIFAQAVRAAGWLAVRVRMNMLVVAVMALRATSLRAIALAAMGSIAVFGTVAIEGAHRDVVRGLDHNFADYLGTADLWITTGGDENSLTTESFHLGDALQRVRAVASVAAVRAYYGGLLDVGDRRVWIVGRPAGDRTPIPPSQLERGDLAQATARLRSGGWVAVSDAIARAHRTHLGGTLALPTPSGTRSFRVAATLTNLGWGPGAIVMSAADYRRAWKTADPTALEVDLAAGADPTFARTQLRAVLAARPALRVQTTAERGTEFRTLARQGLDRLSQISALLLVAAALSLAAGAGASIWQRRRSLAAYRLQGFLPRQLWRAVLLEAGIVLGIGCLAGAVAGLYGHLLGGRWLRLTTGYPAPFSIAAWQTLEALALVVGATIAIVAVPGYIAAQAPARTGLQE